MKGAKELRCRVKVASERVNNDAVRGASAFSAENSCPQTPYIKSDVYIRITWRLVRISPLDVCLSATKKAASCYKHHGFVEAVQKLYTKGRKHTPFLCVRVVSGEDDAYGITIPGTQGTQNILPHGVPQYPCRRKPTVACSLLAPLSLSLSLSVSLVAKENELW